MLQSSATLCDSRKTKQHHHPGSLCTTFVIAHSYLKKSRFDLINTSLPRGNQTKVVTGSVSLPPKNLILNLQPSTLSVSDPDLPYFLQFYFWLLKQSEASSLLNEAGLADTLKHAEQV